jgi:hypothetical protein
MSGTASRTELWICEPRRAGAARERRARAARPGASRLWEGAAAVDTRSFLLGGGSRGAGRRTNLGAQPGDCGLLLGGEAAPARGRRRRRVGPRGRGRRGGVAAGSRSGPGGRRRGGSDGRARVRGEEAELVQREPLDAADLAVTAGGGGGYGGGTGRGIREREWEEDAFGGDDRKRRETQNRTFRDRYVQWQRSNRRGWRGVCVGGSLDLLLALRRELRALGDARDNEEADRRAAPPAARAGIRKVAVHERSATLQRAASASSVWRSARGVAGRHETCPISTG